ncbi:hypothetical protein Tco_1562069 [Tanacetum coccineum]
MDKLPDDMIGLYEQYFKFSGIRVPFSTFLLAVIKHFLVHISQLVPLGLNRLTMFELYCRSLGIVPSVNLFRVFYKISKQGHWFSFEKRVGKGAGGQIFRETFSRLKGWKKRFFFLDRRAIPDAMAWRHHDSDVNDPVLEDGFNASDVQLLTEQIVDLRPVPSGRLFQGGLATTWDFPGFRLTFKDTEGNVVTMSEYLRFPFMFGASISKGPPLTSQNPIEQHTTRPLPSERAVPEKTDHQKRVEVEDPKIVAIRERKARAAAKKREKKRGGEDGGEGSRPKTKRKKIVVLKDNLTASEATSSPRPLRTFDPNQTNPSDTAATTAESQEDRSPLASPRGSAAHSANYSDAHRVNEETDTLRLGTSGGQSGKVLTNADTEVVRPSLVHHSTNHSPPVTQMDSPLRSIQRGNVDEGESSRGRALYVPDWSIHRRCRLDTTAWCRELQVHLAPPVAQEESNALNNATALDRAWFSLARGALAQTDILERFEHLQTDFDKLAEEHAGCEDTQSLRIKELEDLLAKKDYALVYAERINAERAQEKEKLVTQLGKTEMEKFDSIRKLLPTMVERLLQSHEYKKSLSEPFNLAIQAGWGKGLAEERSEEDLLNLWVGWRALTLMLIKR